ncbi:MAG TPA: protein kinase [Vicinamibacterales bacterium]|nr:protein kinase [Vicinamibacterales bacterium]
MTLLPGMRLGAYEVTAPLGAGGMGEVYRVRDSKLKREVALKVLPADVASTPERLARFQREAELLASLNHPNIAHVYGLEESGGITALVMELVEGEDLSHRIAAGAIPIDEALLRARSHDPALRRRRCCFTRGAGIDWRRGAGRMDHGRPAGRASR